MERSTKSNGLLLGTLIGGAIGAVSAFLLAPKTGANLRKDIATKYRDTKLADRVSEITGNVTDKVNNVKDKMVDKTSEVKENIVNAWQDNKEEVKREADSKRQPFSDYK